MMALANSVTLRLAGITANTPDPPGGVIVRDAQGNPPERSKTSAMDYVYRVAPPLSHEQRLKAINVPWRTPPLLVSPVCST